VESKVWVKTERPNFHAIIGPNGMCMCGVEADGTVVTCGGLLDALIRERRTEDYRSGYSAGYSHGKNGEPMRDEQSARLFYGEAQATNAVDPSAQLPGTPTPRDSKSSSFD
jgi:hypothetical protein